MLVKTSYKMKPPVSEKYLRYHKSNYGLVGWWLMNEGSGVTLFDLTGNRNKGAITGATWGVGKSGSTLVFSGTDQYVNCGNGSTLDVTEGMTIIARVKFTAAQKNKGIVGKYSTGGTERGFFLVTDQAAETGKFSFAGMPTDAWNVDYMATSTNEYNDGEWHDVCARFSPAHAVQIFVDGIQDGESASAPSGINSTTSILAIGSYAGLATNEFKGSIDNVMIWNRALAISEIKLLQSKPFCMFERVRWPALTAPRVQHLGKII